jgi:hypothetical protein
MDSTRPTKKRMAMTWFEVLAAAMQKVSIVQTSSQEGIHQLGRTLVRITWEGNWPTT